MKFGKWWAPDGDTAPRKRPYRPLDDTLPPGTAEGTQRRTSRNVVTVTVTAGVSLIEEIERVLRMAPWPRTYAALRPVLVRVRAASPGTRLHVEMTYAGALAVLTQTLVGTELNQAVGTALKTTENRKRRDEAVQRGRPTIRESRRVPEAGARDDARVRDHGEGIGWPCRNGGEQHDP